MFIHGAETLSSLKSNKGTSPKICEGYKLPILNDNWRQFYSSFIPNFDCDSQVKPTPVKNPQLVVCSLPALQLLDLGPEEAERKELAEYFAGNRLLPGSEPAAHCYCGHQFGSFAGQLGDGATM